MKLYRQGAEYGYFPGSIKPYLRLPSGHPEGFHEALANLHRTLEWTIRGRRGETVPTPFDHPGIADGVAGMAFVEAAVARPRKTARGWSCRRWVKTFATRGDGAIISIAPFTPFPLLHPHDLSQGPNPRATPFW